MPISLARKALSRRSVSPSARTPASLKTPTLDHQDAGTSGADKEDAKQTKISAKNLKAKKNGGSPRKRRGSMPALCEHEEMNNDLQLSQNNENQQKIPRRVSSPGSQSLLPVEDQKKTLKSCMSVPSLEQSLLGDNSKGDSSTNKSSSDGTDTKIKRSVSFHSIQVREYSMTLGNHPAVRRGPPVTLSWDYNPSHAVVSVDDFETYRPPRRTRSQIYIPPRQREEMLRNDLGIGNGQLRRARVEVSKVQEQRQRTLATLHNAHVEEAMENAKRKVKRFVSRTSKEKEEEKLWMEAKKIADQKKKQAREKRKDNEFQTQENTATTEKDECASAWTVDDTVDDEGPLSF